MATRASLCFHAGAVNGGCPPFSRNYFFCYLLLSCGDLPVRLPFKFILTKKRSQKGFLFLVRIKGVEPPRRRHRLLRPARLPIPPYPHSLVRFERFVFRSPFRAIFPTTFLYYHTPQKMSTFLKAIGTTFFVEAKKNIFFSRAYATSPPRKPNE